VFRAAVALWLAASATAAVFQAGTWAVDISPTVLPIRRSGGFLVAVGERLEAPLYARALAMDDGSRRVVLVIADTLMMPRELLDGVKQQAWRATGVPPDQMLIAATHTHSAPPVMGALGTDEEPAYAAFLAGRLVEVIRGATARLRPARLGWSAVPAPEFTHCRRWILRPDRVRKDPFGELTVRANMHPGYQNPEFVGPAGPVDSELTIVAFQTKRGEPLALLANYSMHYVGVSGTVISPDYFGYFAEEIARGIGARPDFVAMMSQGTSGDQHWMDYSRPKQDMDARTYAAALARRALEAYRRIRYRDEASLRMQEATLELRRRTPSPQRLAWARAILAQMKGAPRNQQEVYAREQIFLDAEPQRGLKLQALRIGELGIAAIPCEVFGITGLKIKAASPLVLTFAIELANGAEGYIPPPEQHLFGGYTTWPARTAGLEVDAEPKIVEGVLSLLEQVSGRSRRRPRETPSPAARAIGAERPFAWWRLEELNGPVALDSSGHGRHARYEGRLAFYLDGAPGLGQAPYFAGGRLRAMLTGLRNPWTLTLWFRPFATGGVLVAVGDQRLVLDEGGRLVLEGPAQKAVGPAPVELERWHKLAMVHERSRTRVYLDGELAIASEVASSVADEILIGGGFEGYLDEVAVFARVLGQ